MYRKKALVSGITGELGSYLAELLLSKGYEVHGLLNTGQARENRLGHIKHLEDEIILHTVALDSYPNMLRVIKKVGPNEFYHLDDEENEADESALLNANINSTHCILQVLRDELPRCRFFFAASSQIYGETEDLPQTEESKFYPSTTYGISKVSGYELTRMFRQVHGLYACSGILFPSHSPRVKLGHAQKISVENLAYRFDWGQTKEYAQVVWRMVQEELPADFVIATGKVTSVRQLITTAFSCIGLNYWEYIEVEARLPRLTEQELLIGDASKARRQLGWTC